MADIRSFESKNTKISTELRLRRDGLISLDITPFTKYWDIHSYLSQKVYGIRKAELEVMIEKDDIDPEYLKRDIFINIDVSVTEDDWATQYTRMVFNGKLIKTSLNSSNQYELRFTSRLENQLEGDFDESPHLLYESYTRDEATTQTWLERFEEELPKKGSFGINDFHATTSYPVNDNEITYPYNDGLRPTKMLEDLTAAYLGVYFRDNFGHLNHNLRPIERIFNGEYDYDGIFDLGDIQIKDGFLADNVSDKYYYNSVKVTGYDYNPYLSGTFSFKKKYQGFEIEHTDRKIFEVDMEGSQVFRKNTSLTLRSADDDTSSLVTTGITSNVSIALNSNNESVLLCEIENNSGSSVFLREIKDTGKGVIYRGKIEESAKDVAQIEEDGKEEILEIKSVAIQDSTVANDIADTLIQVNDGYYKFDSFGRPAVFAGSLIRFQIPDETYKVGMVLEVDHEFSMGGYMLKNMLVKSLRDSIDAAFTWDAVGKGWDESQWIPEP